MFVIGMGSYMGDKTPEDIAKEISGILPPDGEPTLEGTRQGMYHDVLHAIQEERDIAKALEDRTRACVKIVETYWVDRDSKIVSSTIAQAIKDKFVLK